MIGVDLFAGAGGMSLGALAAEVDIRLAVERDPNAATTYAINHPDIELFQDDIRNLTEINLEEDGDEIIVFGGPPCPASSFLAFLNLVGVWDLYQFTLSRASFFQRAFTMPGSLQKIEPRLRKSLLL